ncbi:hypothetical protein ABWL39_07200 [Chitinivorax sp. PXF-14]|uniref:hypothetical protein n=1 Tax=Chitinivorax sp. PXF-14 TaxID=3230488 RepID=UPI003467415E
MAKRDLATDALRTKGWYRQLQHILLGEVTGRPDVPRMLHAMALKGLPMREGRATYGRWYDGKCRPDADYVKTLTDHLKALESADKLAASERKVDARRGQNPDENQVASKLEYWWREVAPDSLAVKDNQIRLLGHIDWWAAATVDAGTLQGLLLPIWDRWEPKMRGVWSTAEGGERQRWEIASWKGEPSPGRVHYELAHCFDLTSMAVFLVSLCNLPWPNPEMAAHDLPYQHDTAFSTWCVDTVSCCMLVERLYQQRGGSSYSLASPGVDVASRVLRLVMADDERSMMKPSSSPYIPQNRLRQLTDIFKRSGVPVDDPIQFHRSFSALSALIGKMLEECGSSTTEVARLRNTQIRWHWPLPGRAEQSVQ